MEIEWIDQTESITKEQQAMLDELLQYAAKELELTSDTEMSVTFVDNPTIQQYNRDYRQKDQPTDVISFAIEDEGEDELSIILDDAMDLPRELGDILISVERAQEQAEEYGHSLNRELGFLAVHGFLHLNGYDHMTEEEEKEMFGLQEKILRDYGLTR